MDVSCPACAARYIAEDEQLRGKTARMRCRACDTVWLLSGPPAGEKRAAVIKRGAERERRDLFASRPTDYGSVKQTLRPPPPNDGEGTGGGTVAARNENSVLFTVDSLQGNAIVKTPAPGPATNAKDDSGIIDLKALSTRPPPANRPQVMPLFASEAPPAAFAVDAGRSPGFAPAPMRVSKALRVVAGLAAAVVVLGLGGLGVSLAFRGEEPVVRAAIQPPALPAAPPPVAATAPKPADPPPPATTPDSSDDASDKTLASKKGKHKHKGAKYTKSRSSTAGSSTAGSTDAVAVSRPPPKPADTCGCHGDFQCIIRCAAKGK